MPAAGAFVRGQKHRVRLTVAQGGGSIRHCWGATISFPLDGGRPGWGCGQAASGKVPEEVPPPASRPETDCKHPIPTLPHRGEGRASSGLARLVPRRLATRGLRQRRPCIGRYHHSASARLTKRQSRRVIEVPRASLLELNVDFAPRHQEGSAERKEESIGPHSKSRWAGAEVRGPRQADRADLDLSEVKPGNRDVLIVREAPRDGEPAG